MYTIYIALVYSFCTYMACSHKIEKQTDVGILGITFHLYLIGGDLKIICGIRLIQSFHGDPTFV